MRQLVKSGKYIVAVSGGVDSIVLLDMLSVDKKSEYVVAHFDHGIRDDSQEDLIFVRKLAKKYSHRFVSASAKLGSKTSEDTARQARYNFLFSAFQKTKADAIITAHHYDDVIETMLINILRGTGRKGLSSLKSDGFLLRPLIKFSKDDLVRYANRHKLVWREDSTNTNDNYLRNWLRLNILPQLNINQKQQLLNIYRDSLDFNNTIDEILDELIGLDYSKLNRNLVISLSHCEAKELVAHWLRINDIEFDSILLERLVIAIKTYQSKTYFSLSKNKLVYFEKLQIKFI